MKDTEKKNQSIFSLLLAFAGVLIIQFGLPFSISASISGNESLGWRIAALIISTLFTLGVSFSLITTGLDILISHAYPDRQFFLINFALLLGSFCLTTFISYKTIYWLTSTNKFSYTFVIFWITSTITWLCTLYYSHRKIKKRIVEVSRMITKTDEYLDELLIEIKNNRLSYGAAFSRIKKEIPDDFYRIKCTNRLIFSYQKLTTEQKRNDFELYSKDKNAMIDAYPLKYYYK